MKISLNTLKGVGPKTYNRLNNLNLYTVEDALFNYPRTYVDKSQIKHITSISDGAYGTVKCVVQSVSNSTGYRKKKGLLKLIAADDSGRVELVFFNAGYLENRFKIGEEYYFFGQIKCQGFNRMMYHPEFIETYARNLNDFLAITPVYALTDGLSQKDVYKLQKTCVLDYFKELEDDLPEDIIRRNKLCSLEYAIGNIHFPQSVEALKVAKFRLVFDELFKLQLGLFSLKGNLVKKEGLQFENVDMQPLLDALPFTLTEAQMKVWSEIKDDMTSDVSMNRLIQGDVGSGKTAVALTAMYMAAKNGYQTVMMAPTEILAEQHYNNFKKMLEGLDIEVGLLSRSVKQKKVAIEGIASGKYQMVIGTHALIQDTITFHNLGLVITDEQHRFGVRQRNLLDAKGENPDVLIMTATPIPRTLSLILYGDVDISVIDQLPSGRKKIKTYYISQQKEAKMYEFIGEEIQKGRQVYFVCPLIEESETLELKSAQEIFEQLKNEKYPDLNVGLIHGKMKAIEKDEIMKAFSRGEIDILVSTTVIEVGIDVPNATTMVIVNSERFGLSQLHQLRGRVGRGSEQSYCFLLSDKLGKISKERIKTLCETNDGFKIADKDLVLRGPGELLGVRQHGLPELRIADLSKHSDILKLAQVEAKQMLQHLNDDDFKYREEINNILDQLFDRFAI